MEEEVRVKPLMDRRLDWDAGDGHLYFVDEGGNPEIMTDGHALDLEFARRVVATWNWSVGVRTETLEKWADEAWRGHRARAAEQEKK